MASTQSNSGFSSIQGIQDFLYKRLPQLKQISSEDYFDISDIDFSDSSAFDIYAVSIKVGAKSVRRELYGFDEIDIGPRIKSVVSSRKNAESKVRALTELRKSLIKLRDRLFQIKNNALSNRLNARVPTSWTIYVGYLEPSESHIRYDGRELPYAVLIPSLMAKGYDPLLPLRNADAISSIKEKMKRVISDAMEAYSKSKGRGNPTAAIKRGMKAVANEAREVVQNYIYGSVKPVPKAALAKSTIAAREAKEKAFPSLYKSGIEEPLTETGMLANDVTTSVEESGMEELATNRAQYARAYREVRDSIKIVEDSIEDMKVAASPKRGGRSIGKKVRSTELSASAAKRVGIDKIRAKTTLRFGGFENAKNMMLKIRNDLITYKRKWAGIRERLGGGANAAWRAEAAREGKALLGSINGIMSSIGMPQAGGISSGGRLVVKGKDGTISPYSDNKAFRGFLDMIGFVDEI